MDRPCGRIIGEFHLGTQDEPGEPGRHGGDQFARQDRQYVPRGVLDEAHDGDRASLGIVVAGQQRAPGGQLRDIVR